jgi:hypothetical protein
MCGPVRGKSSEGSKESDNPHNFVDIRVIYSGGSVRLKRKRPLDNSCAGKVERDPVSYLATVTSFTQYVLLGAETHKLAGKEYEINDNKSEIF